ncbi:hypothetical protein DPMN_112219 [Dreissena polymorpha]|uniref:Uncharacterized protein n=1 Tax=Dreissena polymorpha TaxID=45954 RepID=A0A9D4KG33_DREPO|nr:hypothetical protein DPMN_112219 [Dreissena polymorpha]
MGALVRVTVHRFGTRFRACSRKDRVYPVLVIAKGQVQGRVPAVRPSVHIACPNTH